MIDRGAAAAVAVAKEKPKITCLTSVLRRAVYKIARVTSLLRRAVCKIECLTSLVAEADTFCGDTNYINHA